MIKVSILCKVFFPFIDDCTPAFTVNIFFTNSLPGFVLIGCCLVLLRSAYLQAEVTLRVGRPCAEMQHLKDLLSVSSQSLFSEKYMYISVWRKECSVGRLMSCTKRCLSSPQLAEEETQKQPGKQAEDIHISKAYTSYPEDAMVLLVIWQQLNSCKLVDSGVTPVIIILFKQCFCEDFGSPGGNPVH